MKKLLTAAAITLGAATAQAQSIPPGFELDGTVSLSYAFEGGNSGSFGFANVRLGYRHEVNADFAIGAGVRGLGFMEDFGDFESQFDFYAYVDYQNFRLSYGAVDNAAASFDWEFSTFASTVLQFAPITAPIGLHPEFMFANDIIRLDADFGRYQLSASYAVDFSIASIAGQTQFGNTRVLGVVEMNTDSGDSLVTLGAHHIMGNLELGGVVGFAPAGGEDSSVRVSATYHVNDDISLKAVYYTVFDGEPFYLYEIAATYQFNDVFSIGASFAGADEFSSLISLSATATF